MKLYQEIATKIQARINCKNSKNYDWFERHSDDIAALVREHMPSGSGFDSGTKLELDVSHPEKLVFKTSFHHMAESGTYSGWTEHSVVVTPSLAHGFSLSVTGRDRNEIKEYIWNAFHQALDAEIKPLIGSVEEKA